MIETEQIINQVRDLTGAAAMAAAVLGDDYTPYEVAVAMNLYRFNVSASDRAKKLYIHFGGQCYDREELTRLVDDVYWVGSMPPPTAAVYLFHALERYGDEARARTKGNFGLQKGNHA